MGLQLVKSPIGHKLSEASIDAVIIDSSGEALVYTGFAHALSDGEYIYIESNFDSYNGYKYVDSISYDSFKIRDSENSDNVAYVQDADISYRVSVLDHGWQCVHLPIVYEIESDLYPNNIAEEEYTPITIVSQSNNLGYTKLELSAGISGATALNYINLVGDNDLSGSYQILDAPNPWSLVIDLAYDSGNDFTSLQVVNYYNNYVINVRVVAGYAPSHRWVDTKPFEVAATLQFIPDSNNRIKFSISEVLRSYINTRNNLTLDTLPNNTDFMVSFYIEYFESYDQSDGVEITTEEGELNTDDFVGYAVNAKLPFKSESISHLSDYINEDVYLAQWLTLQSRPFAVVGRFFDLSFINQFNNTDLEVYVNGVIDSTIVNPGSGVIRVPLEFETEGEYCVQVYKSETPGFTPATLPALNTWTNVNTGGPSWFITSSPYIDFDLLGLFVTSDTLYTPYTFVVGVMYSFDYVFSGVTCGDSYIKVFDAGMSVLLSLTVPADAAIKSGTYSFIAPSGATGIGIIFAEDCSCGGLPGVCQRRITSFVNSTPSTPSIPASELTESICIDAVEECSSTFIEPPDDIRLTEDGDFRILE